MRQVEFLQAYDDLEEIKRNSGKIVVRQVEKKQVMLALVDSGDIEG